MNKNTKELLSNTFPYTWIANELILTQYPTMSDYYQSHSAFNACILITTYNHDYETINRSFIIKDFEISIDGTVYDQHEIAKRMNVPNIKLLITDIDIKEDYNGFCYNIFLNEFRKNSLNPYIFAKNNKSNTIIKSSDHTVSTLIVILRFD